MKSITIIGRRWFDSFGNTYHSVIAYIDGEEVVDVRYKYGYSNQYLYTAQWEMDKLDLLPGLKHFKRSGGTESLWGYCDRNKIKLIDSVTDVSRKKDL